MTAFAASKTSPSPSPAASASASPSAKASPSANAPRTIPFHGTIASVDQSAKTFTMAGKETSRVIAITDKTVITKGGATAAMTDVAANEAVRGSYWKQADGTMEAKTVKLGEKTEGEKAGAGKKSKKAGAANPEASASPKASPSPSASPKK
jgi:hypothetical protein